MQLLNDFYNKNKLDSEYYAAIGDLFMISKDYKLAIKNYTEAIRIKPYLDYFSKRADAYREIGDMENYEADKYKYEKYVDNPNYSYKPYYKKPESDIFSKIKLPSIDPKIRKIAAISLTVFAFVLFHPTKETMYCDQNLICQVKRTYFWIFNFNKKIILNPASDMTCRIGVHAKGRHTTYYGLYLKFDRVSPFIFYVADSSSSDYESQKKELYYDCSRIYIDFRKYISNYEKFTFQINSKANSPMAIFGLIFLIYILYCIFKDDTEYYSKK
jgi:hypothetical protein